MKYKIYSRYDGWAIQKGATEEYWSWGYEDFEEGVGGEKIFGEILKQLGHEVEYVEDC